MEAMDRKQIRQMPNFLIKALGRPHMGHRLYFLVLNLGSLLAFTTNAVLAKIASLKIPSGNVSAPAHTFFA